VDIEVLNFGVSLTNWRRRRYRRGSKLAESIAVRAGRVLPDAYPEFGYGQCFGRTQQVSTDALPCDELSMPAQVVLA